MENNTILSLHFIFLKNKVKYFFGKFFNYIFVAYIEKRLLQIIWPQSISKCFETFKCKALNDAHF